MNGKALRGYAFMNTNTHGNRRFWDFCAKHSFFYSEISILSQSFREKEYVKQLSSNTDSTLTELEAQADNC